MSKLFRSRILVTICTLLFSSFSFSLVIPEEGHEKMIKRLQNPITHFASLPLRYDIDKDQSLSFRPMVPLKLTESWFLISRSVFTYLPKESFTEAEQSFFISPAKVKESDIIWGAGVVAHFEKEGMSSYGPTLSIFNEQDGPIAYGFLAQQLWSDEVNRTNLIALWSYTWKNGYSFLFEAEETYDSKSETRQVEGDVTASIQKIVNVGDDSLSLSAGLKGLSHGPEEDRFDYGVRLMFTYIYMN